MTDQHWRESTISAGEAETRRTAFAADTATQVSSDGLVTWLKENFGRLDEDNNGKINKREIQLGITNPDLATAHGAIYLSAMQDQLSQWTTAFEPEKFQGSYSHTGIAGFEKARTEPNLMQQNQERLNLLGLVQDFPRVDRGQDDRIDMNEIDRALRRPGWTASQIETLQKAKEHYDAILNASTEGQNRSQMSPEEAAKEQRKGISREDLQAFPDQRAKALLWMDNSVRFFDRRLNEMNAQPDQLVSQGLNNSCFFMAPALQMQMEDPQRIKSMIKDNPDGTRTVTFPGAKDNPITVAPPTQAELISYANNRDIATLEKAFGIIWHKRQSLIATEEKREPPVEWPAPAERLQFGHVTFAMQVLHGKETHHVKPDKKSLDELHEHLTDIANKQKPLIISSQDSKSNALYGITPRHSYVAEYDPQTRKLTVTNPLWLGAGVQEPTHADRTPLDGTNDRTFQISLQELHDRFQEIVTTKD